MATKATKEITHALKWLAAEFKFLKQLDQDLQKIDQEPLKDKEKDIKKDQRVVRYIGKSERRLESDVKDIIKQLEKDRGVNIKTGKLKTIITELTVPANELITKGSLYVGDLKKRLKKMRTDAAIAEKYPSKPHQDLIHTELENLDSEVRTLIRWITGLDIALKKAASFFEEEVQAGIIREINGILAYHLEKLRNIFSPDGKRTDPVWLYIANSLATPEHLLFSDWSAEEIRKEDNISSEFVNFLKNVHQGIGIVFRNMIQGKKETPEAMLSEMRIIKDKLRKIISEKSIELNINDRENISDLYKNLLWVLDFKLREQVPIQKLREGLVKITRKLPSVAKI